MLSRYIDSHLPRAVYWLALLAFVLRLGARLRTGIADFWVNGYRFFFDMAQGIARKGVIGLHGAPSAFRVPLYPILLAGLTFGHKAFWPIAIAQSLIGAGTVVCAALLARSMFKGDAAEKAAVIAAAITTIYPYYVIHDTALEETSLFTLLTLVVILALRRADASGSAGSGAVAGVLLGLDVLTRATIAPFAVLAPIWLVWRRRGRGGAACALLLAVTVFPWLWRNERLTGTPTLSTETGEQVWTGNNGYLFHYYPQQSSDLSKAEALREMPLEQQRELQQCGGDEACANRWFMGLAVSYIRAHPGQTVVDGLRKIGAAFYWLPSPRHGRFADLVHAFSYGPVMLLGFWGMWRRRGNWREDLPVYLLFVTFAMVTAVFWAHTSHRSYLDVYWIVFGAGALAESGLRLKFARGRMRMGVSANASA
jgi:hypothetical protein